jgi:hypothetical protein
MASKYRGDGIDVQLSILSYPETSPSVSFVELGPGGAPVEVGHIEISVRYSVAPPASAIRSQRPPSLRKTSVHLPAEVERLPSGCSVSIRKE